MKQTPKIIVGALNLAYRMGYIDRDDEIVRCKDCRYFCSYSDGTYACDSYFGMVADSVDGYCSQAERKDDIVIIHPEDIVFNSEEDEKAYYEALGAERKEE